MRFPDSWNCPDFEIEEFVPPEIFRKYGAKSVWWIRKDRVQACQWIRTTTGRAVTLNTWHRGGRLKERGYRLPDSDTGSDLSQHRAFNAVDISVSGWSARRLFAFIVDNYAEISKFGITTLEDLEFTPTWVHMDGRTWVPGIMPEGAFYIVKPA